MSKSNLSSNLFKRFFIEKSYISSFDLDKTYKFGWKVDSYNVVGNNNNGDIVIDVVIKMLDDKELKKNLFKNYSHKDRVLFSIKKKLDGLSDFLGVVIRNIILG